MIESLHDSSYNNPTSLRGGECKQWMMLYIHVNLRDIWHSTNFQCQSDCLLFSRSNARNSRYTLSHIDHIYVGEALEAKESCVA